jgi:hypothetical protein
MLSSSARAAAGLVTIFALLLAPIPRGREEFWATLENAGHPLLFAFAAVGILFLFRSRQQAVTAHRRLLYPASFVCALALGGMTELAQLFTARDASWMDFFNDGVGAVLGLSLLAASEKPAAPRSRRRVLGSVALLAGLVAIAPLGWSSAAYLNRRLALPDLWRYGNPLDLYFLKADCSSMTLQREPVGAASFALQRCAYAGFSLLEPYPRWQDFRSFSVELSNPDAQPLVVTLRIQDRAHDWSYEDRFNRSFRLEAGERRLLRIPVVDILHGARKRQLDLEHMAQIMVFASATTGREHIVLHAMSLQR